MDLIHRVTRRRTCLAARTHSFVEGFFHRGGFSALSEDGYPVSSDATVKHKRGGVSSIPTAAACS